MQAQKPTLALILAFGALALAVYAVSMDRPDARAADMRLEDLEARLGRLEAARDMDERRTERGPSLRGHDQVGTLAASAEPAARAEAASEAPVAPVETSASPGKGPAESERIQDLVEASVEKKAAEIQVMSNKKPSIGLFAKTLALTDEQRFDVEQEVIRGQEELYRLLGTPTSDGTLLLDDLVEVMAHNLVDPEQARRQWSGFLGRILSERVPGTEETYALRAETAKAAVREGLKRTLTEKQYATFVAWRLDPTEIQGIAGSPWKGIEPRVLDRAAELRTESPTME